MRQIPWRILDFEIGLDPGDLRPGRTGSRLGLVTQVLVGTQRRHRQVRRGKGLI
jgi:hypothetical protein